MALIGIINWVLTKYDLWISKKYKDLFCKMCTRLRDCAGAAQHTLSQPVHFRAQCFSYQPQTITLLSPDRFCVLKLWIRLNRFFKGYTPEENDPKRSCMESLRCFYVNWRKLCRFRNILRFRKVSPLFSRRVKQLRSIFTKLNSSEASLRSFWT